MKFIQLKESDQDILKKSLSSCKKTTHKEEERDSINIFSEKTIKFFYKRAHENNKFIKNII